MVGLLCIEAAERPGGRGGFPVVGSLCREAPERPGGAGVAVAVERRPSDGTGRTETVVFYLGQVRRCPCRPRLSSTAPGLRRDRFVTCT